MELENRPEIEALMAENRTFPPDPGFAARANAQPSLYAEAEQDFEGFWARLARQRLSWDEDFHTTLEWDLPFAKWFVGGKLNIAYNCVDRHLPKYKNKAALIFVPESEDEPSQTITYQELYVRVNEVAAVLRDFCGLKAGDRVTIHMPMIPELPVTMLACARLGRDALQVDHADQLVVGDQRHAQAHAAIPDAVAVAVMRAGRAVIAGGLVARAVMQGPAILQHQLRGLR